MGKKFEHRFVEQVRATRDLIAPGNTRRRERSMADECPTLREPTDESFVFQHLIRSSDRIPASVQLACKRSFSRKFASRGENSLCDTAFNLFRDLSQHKLAIVERQIKVDYRRRPPYRSIHNFAGLRVWQPRSNMVLQEWIQYAALGLLFDNFIRVS